MARDAYLKYDQQAIYNFTSKALDSYKVLTRYLESTVNSEKYFKLYSLKRRNSTISSMEMYPLKMTL